MIRRCPEEIRAEYYQMLREANPGDTIVFNGKKLLVRASADGGKHTTAAPTALVVALRPEKAA